MILYAFIAFLLLFFLIGVSSYFVSKQTPSDYLVAGKNMPPLFVGLSAVATNNSGFMFIGMIGATYSMGLTSIWLMVGWVLGDYLIQRKTTAKIQQAGQSEEVHSFGGLVTNWVGNQSQNSNPKQLHRLRKLIGIITLIFLTVYAAAQLKAGTKATEALLSWSPEMGIMVNAVLIFIYSLAGGLRASIWTDVAQSIVMIIGMTLMVVFGWMHISDNGGVFNSLHAVSETYMNWFPADSNGLDAILFVIGWLFGGFGVIGQPHIVIRFVTLSPQHSVGHMQLYYYSWFFLFYGLTILAGLLSRVLIPEVADFDAELALPLLADKIMPEIFVGLILAALFAATMSTVDSLILACSASLSRDLTVTPTQSIWLTKFSTFIVLVVAVSFAMSNNQTVFNLVLDAWGMLGSAFAPLVLWLALGRQTSALSAITAIIMGMLIFGLFTYGSYLTNIYALTFGFLAGLATLVLSEYQVGKSKKYVK